jgi:hypothetical protein
LFGGQYCELRLWQHKDSLLCIRNRNISHYWRMHLQNAIILAKLHRHHRPSQTIRRGQTQESKRIFPVICAIAMPPFVRIVSVWFWVNLFGRSENHSQLEHTVSMGGRNRTISLKPPANRSIRNRLLPIISRSRKKLGQIGRINFSQITYRSMVSRMTRPNMVNTIAKGNVYRAALSRTSKNWNGLFSWRFRDIRV